MYLGISRRRKVTSCAMQWITRVSSSLILSSATALAASPPDNGLNSSTLPAGNPAALTAAKARLGQLQIPFVENRSSMDPSVAYWTPVASGKAYVLRDGEMVYQFLGASKSSGSRLTSGMPPTEVLAVPRGAHVPRDGKPLRRGGAVQRSDAGETFGSRLAEATQIETVIRERISGEHAKALQPAGSVQAITKVSRMIGSDAKHWDIDAPTYEEVALGEAWPGIDLRLRTGGRSVEKLFTVNPGARSSDIRMQVDGAIAPLSVDSAGRLRIETATGTVEFSTPVAYHPADASHPQQPVEVAYAVAGESYGFRLGDHDSGRAVVIDPLIRATYLGGSGEELTDSDAAFGAGGVLYVAGATASSDLPYVAYRNPNSGFDMFVVKLSGDLTQILAATYLGGSRTDFAYAVAVRGSNVYVAGRTGSTDFPSVSGGAQSTLSGDADGVVIRMNANLGIVQSSFIGGSDFDNVRTLRVASNGDVYVAGDTFSTDFPGTAKGAQPKIGDSQANINYCNNPPPDAPQPIVCQTGDVFIARLNGALTTLKGATYFGGSNSEYARSALAISTSTGEIYAGGGTLSVDVPGTAGGAQSTNGNPTGDPTLFETQDAFIGRFSADLRTRYQATYFGGSAADGMRELVIDPSTGDIYAGSTTSSIDLPGSDGGAQPVPTSAIYDPWIARFNSTLTTLVQSTYLGSFGGVRDLAFNAVNGDLYAAGETAAPDFLGTAGGALNLINRSGNSGGPDADTASYDVFISRLSPDLKTVRQSTYYGSSSNEYPAGTFLPFGDVLVDGASGDIVIFGTTRGADLPGADSGAQPTFGGGVSDAFLARFDATLSGADTIADPFKIAAVSNVQLNTVVSSVPVTVSGVAAPTAISVLDGAYSINGGTFVTTGGSVNNGDSVVVQHTSSNLSLDTVVSTLTIGGQKAAFASTTGDTSPNAFSFTAQTNIVPGSDVTSNTITVAGISIPVDASVGGDASSSFSVNSGPFGTTRRSVNAGDTVAVRHRASYNGNTQVISTMTIGDRSANFSSRTQDVDTNPDAFSFPALRNATTSTRVLSSTITPAGYNYRARVSITGGSGQYSINGGAFTSAAGFISPGQTVQLRTITASTSGTTVTTKLSIGTTTGTFKTTTK